MGAPLTRHRHAGQVVAAVTVLALSAAVHASLGAPPPPVRVDGLRFSAHALPAPPGAGEPAVVRRVHRDYERIDAWISSVGASVAAADVDADGFEDDLCHVDPRFDSVLVAPAPTTPADYAPFRLDPAGVAYDAGTTAPMGCLPGDYDEDGKLDFLVYYWGRPPLLFLAASAYRRPVDVAPPEERWFTNSATRADLDGDGHLDLVVANYFPDGGHVLDAADRGHQYMQSSMSTAANGGRKHLLLRQGNSPDGTPRYADASAAIPGSAATRWTLAVAAADLDGDLLPELYLANDFGPDVLLHNRSTAGHLDFHAVTAGRDFGTPRSQVLGHDSFKGMGADFADLDGDRRLDLFVSNITTTYGLLETNFAFLGTPDPAAALRDGRAPFENASERLGMSRSGWGWDTKMDDYDNDGTLEVVQATGFVRGETNRWAELQELATANDYLLQHTRFWPRLRLGTDISGREPNAFFVRGDDGRYANATDEVGIGNREVSRGLAPADVDGDGDLDLAVANQWDTSWLYRNDCTDCGSSIALLLRVPTTGGPLRVADPADVRDGVSLTAVGASVELTLPSGRTVVTTVDGGNGHSGRRSGWVHAGLGDERGPVGVRVRWRDLSGAVHESRFTTAAGRHLVLLGG